MLVHYNQNNVHLQSVQTVVLQHEKTHEQLYLFTIVLMLL